MFTLLDIAKKKTFQHKVLSTIFSRTRTPTTTHGEGEIRTDKILGTDVNKSVTLIAGETLGSLISSNLATKKKKRLYEVTLK